MKLTIGDKAPDFKGIIQDGKEISLADFRGKKLVLYFYPKDNTGGCTAEACSLRDAYDDFLDRGYAIVGVSPDSERSHTGFITKHGLPFPLIADTGHRIAELYGVWGEKKLYGKAYMGILRTTFVIDEKGIIENRIEKVDTGNHAAQLLNS
ncbi:MAG: thioredoxin-dependent thiol peroxidase [Bacteroidales bacterium]|jgi:peroxiredoxin Q/BCP|nr:thioredoxin-dependent thiol peroxidase [Bacteroidales bacterium]